MRDDSSQMQAAMVRRYGGPGAIRLEQVPRPTVAPGDVRVRVCATPLTAADVRLRSAQVPFGYGLLVRLGFGLLGPRQPIPGWGFSGVVESVAPDVSGLSVGTRVFGLKSFKGGAHAEYLTIPAAGTVLPMPDDLSFEEGAAFFFGGLTAADFLIDKAAMQRGERLAIVGATGSVGTAAISIAKHLGLVVTAVASKENHELAKRLGADALVDYRTQALEGEFDGILDVMGALPRSKALSLLRAGGRLMPVTADLFDNLGAALRPRRGTKRITGSTTSEAKEKLVRLVELHRAGGYRPVVGRTLPFTEIVEAHRIAQGWHKQGNLVLKLA